jgi:small subunit ribosomal protein S6
MAKVINSYETMFIVDLTAGEAAVKATVDKFIGLISSNAELVEVSEWGKRRMAYAIDDKPEGYYVVATFKTESEFPNELRRHFNIDETIMRSLVLKLEYEAVKHEAPVVEEAPVAEEAAAEEAPAAEETPAE